MKGLLLVPIRVDALYLSKEHIVAQAVADFSRLPYFDGKRDIQAGIPYLSEEILAEPFQDVNLHLKAGIHLHWALPRALTRGHHSAEGLKYPQVPNRWLVRRTLDDKVDKQWVVESDYLYPEGVRAHSVTYPVMGKGKSQPFRYLGRVLPLEEWKANDSIAEYLGDLTAIGYGEPTFAAFYPNCHSVFGFHDSDFIQELPARLKYDIIGWYSDSGKDYLANFVEETQAKIKKQWNGGSANEEENYKFWLGELQKYAKWDITGSNQAIPQQMLCFSRLTVAQEPDLALEDVKVAKPAITIGNTGLEALAAHLAASIDPEHKLQAEEQLEVAFLSERLSHVKLDFGAKLREARHERAFASRAGGWTWAIRAEAGPAGPDEQGGTKATDVTLPDDLAHTVNDLNNLQEQYDQAYFKISSLREQLFADWTKYQVCLYAPPAAPDAYPDPDRVRHLIETHDLGPLDATLAAAGQLKFRFNASRRILDVDGERGSLAGRIAETAKSVISILDQHNQANPSGQPWVLKRQPASRYWAPAEPVLMLSGDGIHPSPRHAKHKDGHYLECQVLPDVSVESLLAEQFASLWTVIDGLEGKNPDAGFHQWTEQPWHPFLLQWEVEVFPARYLGNLDPANWAYLPDFVRENYDLPENAPDLTLPSSLPKHFLTRAANIYRGSSILTPFVTDLAQERLTATLVDLLKQKAIDHYKNSGQELPSEEEMFPDLAARWQWYIDVIQKTEEDSPAIDAFHAALEILSEIKILSQALGGFNPALLMRRQARQLPVEDPLGFPDQQAFAARVREALGQDPRYASLPLNDFNPIRSGAMRLLQLRLVDTFGQVQVLDPSDVSVSEPLAGPGQDRLAWLPPRLVQPARLDFRWLAAGADLEEMNSHPATTPVCGWIVPNNLDDSLAVYDARGEALGSLAIDPSDEDPWIPAPGSSAARSENDILNPYLQQVVTWLLRNIRKDKEFGPAFLDALDSALENIDPENFAQHQDLALLMGRPLAIVRAALNLSVQGLPAVDQGWDAFRQDLRRTQRDDDGFSGVRFPLRLGEFSQFNDGLAGYWKESAGGGLSSPFYAVQSEPETGPGSIHYAHDPANIALALNEAPLLVTMLVDPRGVVHATSGILPVQSLRIPADQYLPSLQAISVTFLSAPVLTTPGKLDLPVPAEPGYAWSWLERNPDSPDWTERNDITDPRPEATFNGRPQAHEGWLRIKKSSTMEKDQ